MSNPLLETESEGSICVKGEVVEGYVSVRNMSSFTYVRRNPVLVDKADDESVNTVLEIVRKLFV